MRRFERILNLVTLLVVATVAVLWGLLDVWAPSEADMPRILGFLLGLMAAATLHTWTRYADVRRELRQLAENTRSLAAGSDRLADSVQNPLAQTSFRDAFHHVYDAYPEPRRIRIYAISSQIIQMQLYSYPFAASLCEILIYKPPSEEPWRTFHTRVASVVQDWRSLRASERIRDIRIKRYADMPTEYVVLFDDRFALWGLYHPDSEDYTTTRASDPFIISGKNAATKPMVAELVQRFDLMMASAAD